jgi:hypothetical protein
MKRVTDVLVSGLVFVAVLEVSARVDDRLVFGTPFLACPALADLQISDATGIHGRPQARFRKWEMNSLGVQGKETTLHKPTGTFRVVVLGASESFGTYESPGMSYPAQLQRLLAERLTQPVEVLNAALPGMSLPRVIEFCRARLGPLQPDVVVYYPNPVTYLSDVPPSEVLPIVTEAPRHTEWRFPPKLVNGVNHALPAAFAGWRLDHGQRRALAALRRGRPESWLFRQVPQERLDLFEAHLRKLIPCIQLTGAWPIVSTHANRFPESLTPMDQVNLVAWQIYYPRAEGGALLSMDRAANEVIRRVTNEFGAGLADVAAAVPPSAPLFSDFAHFTNEGSALVAKEFLKVILEARPAPKDEASVGLTRWPDSDRGAACSPTSSPRCRPHAEVGQSGPAEAPVRHQ